MGKGQLTILLYLSDGLTFSGIYYPYKHFYRAMLGYSPGSVRVLLNRLIKTGQIEKIIRNGESNFCLTSRGIKDIKTMLALERGNPKWDGKWSILLAKNGQVKLQKFAFARLQSGVYISPFRIGGTELLVYGYTIETKNISPVDNRKLANIVWTLDTVNNAYQACLTKTQQVTKNSLGEVIVQYTSIVRRDPFLPSELLPKNWYFEKARERLVQLIKRHFSNRKV